MSRSAGMAIGAGPLYVNAVMGQAPSASQRDNVRKTSLQITARHDIDIEESEQQPSRPDSWSMHFDRTDQAPYSSGGATDDMMIQTSLLNLPKENPSRDLAFFLRTTGPTAPHRRPSKIERHPRRNATPKNALRFLRLGHKRSQTPIFPAFEGSPDTLPLQQLGTEPGRLWFRDEGGLLSGKKKRVKKEPVERAATPFVQEVSSTGRRYRAMVPKADESNDQEHERTHTEQTVREPRQVTRCIFRCGHYPLTYPSPAVAVMDSEVFISYADSINSPEVYDTWMCAIAHEPPPSRAISPPRKSSAHLPLREETALRVVNPSSPAVMQRHASNPPSPEPLSAVSLADSYKSDLKDHPAKNSFDTSRALTSHPVHSTTTSSLPTLPNVALPHEEFPVRYLPAGKEMDIKHPSPRRFASHPVLLQRASSITSSLYPQSTSDSPGPPPRSPLRLRRDQRTIENAIASNIDRDPTPKPFSCAEVGEFKSDILPIKPTVTTDCTGPIKRPDFHGKGQTSHPGYPSSRKEREEKTKARKLRDKPAASRTIDTLVNVSPRSARQRLKKARPQISIPDLHPPPLNTRSSSTASSNASWKKITEFTRTPVSAVPSETAPISATGYTPVSPTASNTSAAAANEPRMTLSPVMLVAEEVPFQKAKTSHKPARLVVKHTPRPRSASLPRNALKRRSIARSRPSTRASSPAPPEPQDDEAPPLPSPPPTRKLPPTPPASGSEKPKKTKVPNHLESKELPPTPMHWLASSSSSNHPLPPQITSGAEQFPPPTNTTTTSNPGKPDIDTRLAALEHQNKLLSAALMAVLKTNGERNVPLTAAAAAAAELTASLSESPRTTPAAWETRIARRKASDAASSSNGSALEMYMSTRRGSRHGF